MIELHTAGPVHIPFLNPMAPIGTMIQATRRIKMATFSWTGSSCEG